MNKHLLAYIISFLFVVFSLNSQEKELKNRSIKKVFFELEKKCQVKFSFSDKLVDNRLINIDLRLKRSITKVMPIGICSIHRHQYVPSTIRVPPRPRRGSVGPLRGKNFPHDPVSPNEGRPKAIQVIKIYIHSHIPRVPQRKDIGRFSAQAGIAPIRVASYSI